MSSVTRHRDGLVHAVACHARTVSDASHQFSCDSHTSMQSSVTLPTPTWHSTCACTGKHTLLCCSRSDRPGLTILAPGTSCMGKLCHRSPVCTGVRLYVSYNRATCAPRMACPCCTPCGSRHVALAATPPGPEVGSCEPGPCFGSAETLMNWPLYLGRASASFFLS